MEIHCVSNERTMEDPVIIKILEEFTMKKSTLVLAVALTLGVTATAFAANPFSDVPKSSWGHMLQ